MKTADIITSSNVSIEYELAGVQQRMVAFLIDLLLLIAYEIIIIMIAQSMSDREAMALFYFIFFPPAFFCYHLISEVFFGGQSIGKRSMGIKVISSNGQNPTLNQFATRWVFRMIDIMLSAGGLAVLFISSSEHAQRLGDRMAQTLVIRLQPTNTYSVNDILNIKRSDDYEVTYPQVTRFTDDDMILIKNVLDRRKKHTNSAHNKLVHELCDKVCKELKMEVPANNKKIKFLRKILQDYVVITRS